MARPAKSVKSVPLNLSLDGDIADRMKKDLFSDLEGKIPHGAQSKLINSVLRTYYRSQDAKAAYARTQLAAEQPGMKEKVAADLEGLMKSPE